ncbi:MAG: amino acid transporter [Pseudomonadales bacterium]
MKPESQGGARAADAAPRWDGPGLEAWMPWTPEEVTKRLAGVATPWCLVGGWAIDVWFGRQTRSHADIELTLPRSGFSAMRGHLAGFELRTVGQGEVRRLAPGRLPPADRHQCWVLDPAAGSWRLDLMLDPGDAHTWIFRRDHRIQAPRGEITQRRDGIPYLKPEAVLLFKARSPRPKDEADFAVSLPALGAAARAWLAAALTLIHPGHHWLGQLGQAG